MLFRQLVFPMVLQQTSSFSYDSIVLAATVVIIALGLRWGFTEQRPIKSEMLIYFGFSIILIGAKGGSYSLFCFLPMLYGFSKEKLKVLWSNYKKQILALFILFIVIMFSGTIKNVLNSSAMEMQDITQETKDEYIISWAGEEGYTMSWVLEHPFETMRIWYVTILHNWTFYMYTLFGSSLGAWQIGVPVWIIWLYLAMSLGSTISVKQERYMTISDRILVVLLSAFSLWQLCSFTGRQ